MKKIALMLSLVLSGCIPTVQMTKNFDTETHKQYAASGNASINGQAFLKQNGGGVVTCAGEQVILMPGTEFFQEIISVIKTRRKPAVEGSSYKDIARKTVCDAQGNFTFENLPNLKWIVVTEVKWLVSGMKEGGLLSTEVDLTSSDKGKAIMSQSIVSY